MWQFLWFGRQVDTGPVGSPALQRGRQPVQLELPLEQQPVLDPARGPELGQPRPRHRWRLAHLRLHALARRDGALWDRRIQRAPQEHLRGGHAQRVVAPTGAFGETSISRRRRTATSCSAPAWPGLEGMTLSGASAATGGTTATATWARTRASWWCPGSTTWATRRSRPATSDYRESTRVNSLYGSANFGFRDFWFVEGDRPQRLVVDAPGREQLLLLPVALHQPDLQRPGGAAGVSYGKVRLGWARWATTRPPTSWWTRTSPTSPFDGRPRFTASNRCATST
jgi:hypothetical protein